MIFKTSVTEYVPMPNQFEGKPHDKSEPWGARSAIRGFAAQGKLQSLQIRGAAIVVEALQNCSQEDIHAIHTIIFEG
jgi:hypothetical protein